LAISPNDTNSRNYGVAVAITGSSVTYAGGGGGGVQNGVGVLAGAGGSGIVIIRYPIA
jgi:hypothetical protein